MAPCIFSLLSRYLNIRRIQILALAALFINNVSVNSPLNQAMYQYGLALERGVAHTSGGRAKDLAESFK
jgi:hypothetical protein